jgi:hypothetical protein
MRRIIIGLATLAVTTFAAADNYYGNLDSWESYDLRVNWDDIEETGKSIAKKWEDYSKFEDRLNKESAKDLKKALEDAYKDTLAKISMEWGDKIEPLVDHIGEAFDNKTQSGVCDAECAVKCWRANKFDKNNNNWQYGFNVTCFKKCGCAFKPDNNQTRKDFKDAAKKIEGDINDLIKYGEDVADYAANKIVPALDRYNERTSQIMNEYLKTVRSTAINDLGCNATCVNRCTNGYTTCFFELSSCISQCSCYNLDDVIRLEKGQYNYPSLMLYA